MHEIFLRDVGVFLGVSSFLMEKYGDLVAEPALLSLGAFVFSLLDSGVAGATFTFVFERVFAEGARFSVMDRGGVCGGDGGASLAAGGAVG